ncbi:hypothetical protein [Wukongibacter sp. M2B1]|uniref:hypothetical protein n=1 Tax=Wukongibacter sp. M2B1 TaxID=3088895 RepID=UPI003D79F2EA
MGKFIVLFQSFAKDGQIDINDEDKLGKIFLDEVKKHFNVDCAYFANSEGGIVSSGIYSQTFLSHICLI